MSDQTDFSAMMRGISATIRAYVTTSLCQVSERVAELEAKLGDVDDLRTRLAKIEAAASTDKAQVRGGER